MTDPVTGGMAAVGLASTIGGAITGAVGAGETASAQASMYQYKAGLALMNQRINKQNAQWARQSGDINAEEAGLKAGQDIANTKVVQSGSGVDVNTGTAADVRDTQVKVAGFDQDVIRFDAAKTAYGYETKAAGDEAEANLDYMAADNAKKAGNINIFSSILGGASSVASKWSQAKTTGLFGGSSSNGGFDPNGNPI